MSLTVFADEGIAHGNKFLGPQNRGQVQPRPGRRGEPDAVELHHFVRQQRQKMPDDVCPTRHAGAPAAGKVDAPVFAQPGR